MVKRYGPGGTFWRKHPQLTPRPVRVWEIWNEQNARHFFAPRDGKTFRPPRGRRRTRDPRRRPQARIIFGGLAGHLKDSWQVKSAPGFLADAIAAQPSLRRLLDGVAYHSYMHPVKEMTCAMRAELDRLGLAQLAADLQRVRRIDWPRRTRASDRAATRHAHGHAHAAIVNQRTCRRPANIVLVAPYTWWSPRKDPGNPEQWFGSPTTPGACSRPVATYVKAAVAASD